MEKIMRSLKRIIPSVLGILTCAMFLAQGGLFTVQADEVNEDERAYVFPSYGYRNPEGNWNVRIHGWIFEPDKDSYVRNKLLRILLKAIEFQRDELKPDEKKRFMKRAREILSDDESDEQLMIEFGPKNRGKTVELSPSNENGHIHDEITISSDQLRKWLDLRAGESPGGRELPYRIRNTEHQKSDKNLIYGSLKLISPDGLSLISDIDDTVKKTGVHTPLKALENTFFKKFRALEGMPQLYRDLIENDVRLHYLSASPWKLFRPLFFMMQNTPLPAGPFHLKHRDIRIRDNILDLYASHGEFKESILKRIFNDFPKRTFLLVGDSTQSDPAIYGTMARKHPDRVRGILIHNVTDTSRNSRKLQKAFRNVPDSLWSLYQNTRELRTELTKHVSIPRN